jgi:outer membrane protein OmpA-like peptidoglycan-associated protein
MRLSSLIVFVILFNSKWNCQSFKITDTTFGIGEVYTSWKIMFELGRGELMIDASKPVLDSIHKFLVDNPNTIIEIGVHTDFRGSKTDNRRLSQQRADALKSYFTATLITENRLMSKGYGCSKPIVTEEELNKAESGLNYNGPENRRVTITILKM